MELGSRIKRLRGEAGLSQEALSQRLYVTRQSISNWENNKTYPDIDSLLRLSDVFDISLDELVKGDIDKMKESISQESIEDYKRWANYFGVMMVVTILSFPFLYHFLQWTGLAIWAVIALVTLYLSNKIEQRKKKLDAHTYGEIVAFLNGQRLDDIQKAREEGKRNYQKFFNFIIAGGVTFILVTLLFELLSHF